jgi:phosphoribosylformimino-5-aminoimidazole carboxamide ribotide isomerase
VREDLPGPGASPPARPTFAVLPAIDLRAGRCVRLVQGDPGREEVFGDDPVAVARRWVDEGAEALHVVDLDGAFAGSPRQLSLVAAIAAAADVPVQVGGGLRAEADVAAALAAGAARVVVGTRALEEGFLRRLLERWGPERVLVGLDARGDRLAVAGWRQELPVGVEEAARRLRTWGITTVVYTQVLRDGTLQGPDLEGLGRVRRAGLCVVVSGGVGSAADVRAVARAGACGVVLGRALYAGRITLAEARAAAAEART